MISTMRRKMKSRGGFTLVELLVVIVILGILAAIGLQQFISTRDAAEARAGEANARTLTGAAQMYFFINEAFPAGDAGAAITALDGEGIIDAGDYDSTEYTYTEADGKFVYAPTAEEAGEDE